MQRALNMIYGIYFNTALAGKIQSYSQLTKKYHITLVLSEWTIQVYFYVYNKITIA